MVCGDQWCALVIFIYFVTLFFNMAMGRSRHRAAAVGVRVVRGGGGGKVAARAAPLFV